MGADNQTQSLLVYSTKETRTDVSKDLSIVHVPKYFSTDFWCKGLLFCFRTTTFKIRQHCIIQQRCAAAKLLQAHCPVKVPVVADTMWNIANVAYGATPERLYIIMDGRILYQGGVGPFGYNLTKVSRRLNNIITEDNFPVISY